jgi:hypothetical protein
MAGESTIVGAASAGSGTPVPTSRAMVGSDSSPTLAIGVSSGREPGNSVVARCSGDAEALSAVLVPSAGERLPLVDVAERAPVATESTDSDREPSLEGDRLAGDESLCAPVEEEPSDPVESAKADGIDIADPIPNATASAPTRPTLSAVPGVGAARWRPVRAWRGAPSRGVRPPCSNRTNF